MKRLDRKLTLLDVYAVSTGAMFSSGFFLLPGIAAGVAGTSVPWAYAAAGILILPAMLSVAELSTAMPRAGGAYFFLERALGPAAGTVGGLGSWLALVLKSAFALLGMGAYLALFVDVPIVPLALVLTLVFTIINLVGAKETASMQRILVVALVGILAVWLIWGVIHVYNGGTQTGDRPPPGGTLSGFIATIGLVFVSYAGLTKVASIAEEVQDPDRNIPLGMGLSLVTATITYGVGVWVMLEVLPFSAFTGDLTPVATAGATFLPGKIGIIAVVVAATAAFASTANAGLMSSSRYPLAMARDRLVPEWLGKVGRTGVPTIAVWVSAAAMAVFIVGFEVAAVAKLASAFQLLLFGLLCLAVIIMRESQIEYYQPGFRSPLYPWVQIVGMGVAVWLIAEMGWLTIAFTGGVMVVCLGWYFVYGRHRATRAGAIYHVFERLGQSADLRLDHELRSLMGEKKLAGEESFERMIARAAVVDLEHVADFDTLIEAGSRALAPRLKRGPAELSARIKEESRLGLMPVSHGVALPHLRLDGLGAPEIALVRVRDGIELDDPISGGTELVHTVLMVVSPQSEPASHLRTLARLATRVDDDAFLPRWLACEGLDELKAMLIADERHTLVQVDENQRAGWVGRRTDELPLPDGAWVAWIARADGQLGQVGDVLAPGDRVTVIGDADAVSGLTEVKRSA